MSNLMVKLWSDDCGAIVSGELVLVATIAVMGMVAGLAELSHNANQELEDVGSAFGAINQSYSYNGIYGAFACPDGSQFSDSSDFCDGDNDIQPHDPQSE